MLRALFLREFRKSWLVHAGLFAVVFGTIALVSHTLFRESLRDLAGELSYLLSAVLLLSALISGERCFSLAFKEGRYPFLLTLPRPRGGIWLAYLGGRLSGALAAFPVLLLLRPLLPSLGSPFLLLALSGYLVYFLGSAALALALRKEILVYLMGFPLLFNLLFLLTINAAHAFMGVDGSVAVSSLVNPYTLVDRSSFTESPQFWTDIFSGSLLLALVWAIVSFRAFCRGELHLARRMVHTFAEVVFASATFIGLALIAFGNSTLASLRDEWRPVAPLVTSHSVSTDGRFLFIQQQLRKRLSFTRLAIVDLKSGSMTDWMERPGIYQVSWSASEPILNVLTANNNPVNCWGIPCVGSTSWYRLSPDLHVLSTRDFPGTGFFHHFGGGLLLLTRQKNVGRVYRLSDWDGSAREILTSELGDDAPWWEGEPLVWSLGRGAVVVLPKAASLQAWWLDQKGQVQHEESVSRQSGEHYYLVDFRILSSQKIEAEAIRRAGPFPSKSSEIWEPILPNASGPFDFNSSQFYLRSRQGTGTADIWKHDAQQGSWTQILPEFQRFDGRYILELLREGPEHKGSRLSSQWDVDFSTGTWVAAVASEDHQRLFLYDDQLGRSIPNTVACHPGEEGRTSLEQVQGLDGLLVLFTCWDKDALLRSWFLEHRPGSGHLRELAWHSTAVSPKFFDRWLYLDPDGISVWMSRTREIWRIGPGRKPLRLNPPAGS